MAAYNFPRNTKNTVPQIYNQEYHNNTYQLQMQKILNNTTTRNMPQNVSDTVINSSKKVKEIN